MKNKKLTLIAGPCALESLAHSQYIARVCKRLADQYGLDYVFKGSFDKANRTSIKSSRGVGIDRGLNILKEVKKTCDVPVLTDVHEPSQVRLASEVGVDIIQIPAFLSRQTDLLLAAGSTDKVINIKKGQFMSCRELEGAVEKVMSVGNHTLDDIILTERGNSFGYNRLVVDMANLERMKFITNKVCFDATHSTQLPGGASGVSGETKSGGSGNIEALARAAVAVGVTHLFIETHDTPSEALSDGLNMLDLKDLEKLLETVSKIHEVVNAS